MLYAAPVSQPATKPATQAATQPATKPREIIKIASTPDDGKTEPLVMLVDVNDAPQLKEWALKAADYAIKWHPEICKALPSEGYTAPRTVTLIFKPQKIIAFTSGRTISISSEWIKKHPDDLGMVAHELTHVIQHYSGRGNPGWIVEGIADYVRYFIVEPGSKSARFDPARGYKGGYQPAAALLNWLEKEHPGIVVKLNALMREGNYTAEQFNELAGGEPDEVWEKFRETLKEE
jgi:hypothetical protein